MDTRLKSRLVVQALIRSAEVAGAFAAVMHKGDDDAGALILVVEYLGGRSMLYRRDRDGAGTLVWQALGDDLRPPPEVAAILERERARDPDLWVIGIDDPQGTYVPT